jgi:hypothetical protein
MIEIKRNEDYIDKSQYSMGDTTMPCVICGKAIEITPDTFMIYTYWGSHAVTGQESETLQATDPGGDTGLHPIGRDCLKKHPELASYAEDAERISDDHKTRIANEAQEYQDEQAIASRNFDDMGPIFYDDDDSLFYRFGEYTDW